MSHELMLFINTHPILSLSWTVILVSVITTTFGDHLSKVKEISCREATTLINNENGISVDTRSSCDFRKGHLANSINLTTTEIKIGNLNNLDRYKARPIIVISANGTASREAAENLNKLGFNNVSILKDGIAGWIGESLPLVCRK